MDDIQPHSDKKPTPARQYTPAEMADILSKAQARLDEFNEKVASIFTLSTEAQTRFSSAEGVVAATSKNLHDAQLHADSVRVAVDKSATAIAGKVGESEAHLTRAGKTADRVGEIAAEVEAIKSSYAKEQEAFAEAQKAQKAAVDEAVALCKTIKEMSETVAKEADTIKTNQSEIVEKSGYIENARLHAVGVENDLNSAVAKADEALKAIQGSRDELKEALDAIEKDIDSIDGAKKAVDGDAEAIAAAKESANTATATLQGLAEKASGTDARLKAYESRLAELENQSKDRLNTIEKLLEGAITAGLASAFAKRGEAFNSPQFRWQLAFFFALLTLIGVAGYTFWDSFQHPPADFPTIARGWLVRFPLFGALVWIAVYSTREAALAKRLEEEYGFKAAISACFEGFKKQLSELGNDVAPDSALARLLSNTLEIIAKPPGAIYDAHGLPPSPAQEMTKTVVDITKSAGGIKNTS